MAEIHDPAILRGKAELRMTYVKHGKQYEAWETRDGVVLCHLEKIINEIQKSGGNLDKDYLLKILNKVYSEAYQTGAGDTVADVTGYKGFTTVYT